MPQQYHCRPNGEGEQPKQVGQDLAGKVHLMGLIELGFFLEGSKTQNKIRNFLLLL